jgi:tripartite-type tricarboxylate transporter receptor subunit TctC
MRAAATAIVMLIVAACGSTGPASYPSRNVTYLIAFDPGGQSDREARRQQPLLQQYLGRTVVIDYKAGGGGALAWSEAARSRPDGYLLVGINIPNVILQPLQQDTGYETNQLYPVVLFQRTPIALAVSVDSPYQTLDAFVRAAKASPGTISIGSSGTFTAAHLAAARLDQLTGARTTYVPFSGGAPAITAFLGGHTTANFAFSDDLTRYRDRMRILAMATETRSPAFPEVPTFRELGFDLVAAVDRGIAVPRGTPETVVRKLESVFLQIANDPAIQSAQMRDGFVPIAMGSQEAATYIEERTQYYKQLLKELERH